MVAKVEFSHDIPEWVAPRWRTISVDYESGGDLTRTITLGFSFDPTDCHGEDLAFAFRKAIRKAKSDGRCIAINVMHRAEIGNAACVASYGAVSYVDKIVGHRVEHEVNGTSRVYVILKYTGGSNEE